MSNKAIPDIAELQKEFEDYVRKFELARELAIKLRTKPGVIVELFHAVAVEALVNAENIFESELKANFGISFNDVLNDLNNENYKALATKLKLILNR